MTLQKLLNTQIANWNILYTKLHRFHWYVKGPLFFTLHEKFEELYTEAALVIDETAERLLAIGGEPIATLKEYIEAATLQETNGETTANEMVQSLIEDYRKINEGLQEVAVLAEEQNDIITNDLAIGLIQKVDKHIWMLNAYLGE
ncbi:DNA starvation/stationary phase protection protein [Bacillus canaveralius]|uniref:DNA starvation/stationary phase protection protein n=1 Tax=Bacillus canaveralius TaxID=1403243 RepID=A0A2N5GRZ4_9BACI|nr:MULTISPECIES: DNA starvation/stationary phase protection protein [Bacillus]PLR86330.1 DNA starvation/stationary phase protection protein [Bacillus canaveralius]PLR87221.1 DNA starvation/stationary phase protection protein [Bacillus sp. V33-4]PLR98563.1 DNA starvation/stationary phase protection protein [Bacillus canaveralius]RSK50583.1 DNA starvation/stationary phase protection protein [Bacillus canaveralius]